MAVSRPVSPWRVMPQVLRLAPCEHIAHPLKQPACGAAYCRRVKASSGRVRSCSSSLGTAVVPVVVEVTSLGVGRPG
ncbi:hypothetical protein [Streptomyces turgidiscabies]|uniref:hypothetical protein n=1 Tax=Streptomyces turgidiscabies TaxID=85558 RepID=UPI0005C9CF46|nr:hypothetical protein [Streptomyces turgidiscabies]